VKGESRPSLLKITGKNYEYRRLQAIDDLLQQRIVQESRLGSKPNNMKVPQEHFIHALVVNVLQPKVRLLKKCIIIISNVLNNLMQYGNPNYRLVVSDETKENVILRICASKSEPLQGPDIKKGDVIRVHRVTVIIIINLIE
jgi:hypothetical protein